MDYKLILVAAAVLLVPVCAASAARKFTADEDAKSTNERNSSAHDDHKELGPFDQEETAHYYSSEEIEKSRWTSIDRSGIVSVATDGEVIQILEMARHDKSSVLLSHPHVPKADIKSYQEAVRERRRIIGRDDRRSYSAFGIPKCAIGYLATGCTAFLIGPNHALTAGHCVYNSRRRSWYSNMDIYIGRDCRTSGRRMDWTKAWVLSGWINNGAEDYDLAYILLDSADRSTCWLGYGYYDPMPTVSGEICGYPSDTSVIYRCFRCASCNDIRHETHYSWWRRRTNSKQLEYTCDMVGGQSGSPVVTNDHPELSGLYAWGVNAYESRRINENYATRLTRTRFLGIRKWVCDNGGSCP